MSTHSGPVTRTADTDAAAYLLASGLVLLRIDAGAAVERMMCMFVFADRHKRGHALRRAFASDAAIGARSLLQARRHLVRGLHLARASPSRCLTGAELAAYVDAARRRGEEA